MMTIRRLGIGAGYKYLFKSIAVGDGLEKTNESDPVRHCSESGTPPGSSSAPDLSVSTVWRLRQRQLHPFRLSRWRSPTSRHVVILNRARAMSDGACRTIDSRGIFAPTVMFTAIHHSGRWGTRTLDLSRVKVLTRFSPDDATRRQTTLTRTNDNARRREKTSHDAICGAFCGAR